MARTAARKSSAKSRRSSSERSYQNYRDTLLEWSERPAVRYVAGGIGLALLARFTYSMSERYPEISRFLKENLDTIEDRMREFRGISSESSDVEARH